MKNIILLALGAVLMVSCGTTTATLGQKFPLMYSEKPTSIVIMPPINKTTHVEAKDYFYTTLYEPLCERGYYVFSPYLTMELFQSESAYDAEMFLDKDLTQFRNVLGADAAMFTIINDWRRNNVGGKLTVDIEYILRSTKTGETLYSRKGKINVDTSVNSGNAFVSLIATAISTAATDKVVAGRVCNAYVLQNLPAGKYLESGFDKDQNLPAGEDYLKGTAKQ